MPVRKLYLNMHSLKVVFIKDVLESRLNYLHKSSIFSYVAGWKITKNELLHGHFFSNAFLIFECINYEIFRAELTGKNSPGCFLQLYCKIIKTKICWRR